MIVITGANGLLGREVSRYLKNRNHDVVEISRQNYDLTKKNLLNLNIKPKTIIHLAAAVPTSINYEDSIDSANLTNKIDENVINAAKKWESKLIYASSCAVYKKDLEIKHEYSELDLDSSSPYIKAKINGEKNVLKVSNSIICRLPALIGTNMQSKSILLKFLYSSLNNESIKLWGDGSREQNFIDVVDVSKAFNLMLENNADEKILNIANFKTISMKKLAETIIKITNKGDIKYEEIEDPNETLSVRYKVDLAKKILNWEASTPISESIKGIIRQCR